MRMRRLMMRTVLALILTGIIAWLGPARAASRRDFPRCIHACNLIGQACDDRCEAICPALFAGDHDLIPACLSACHAICTEQTKECRILCKPVKDPLPSPAAP